MFPWVLAVCAAAQIGDPREVCTLQDSRIDEASGIVAATGDSPMWYVHNDSGGKPRFFLIDEKGSTRSEIRLQGGENRDWEDCARYRSDHQTFVVVGDIGDNKARQPHITLYRFVEPNIDTLHTKLSVKTESVKLRYPDRPHNAESLMVDGQGVAWIVTKQQDGEARLYRSAKLKWDSSETQQLQFAGRVNLENGPPLSTVITAGDLRSDGRAVVLRTYVGGWLWHLKQGEDVSAITRRGGAWLQLPYERQGEAICFSSDGSQILTVSEKVPTQIWSIPLMNSD